VLNISLTYKTESSYTSFCNILSKISKTIQKNGGLIMAEEKGLNKPVKLKGGFSSATGS